jgi:hypothetical protein
VYVDPEFVHEIRFDVGLSRMVVQLWGAQNRYARIQVRAGIPNGHAIQEAWGAAGRA